MGVPSTACGARLRRMATTVPMAALTKARLIQAKLTVNSISTRTVSGVTAPANNVSAIW